MSYDMYGFSRYVSVGEKQEKAEKKLQALRKKNPNISPVVVNGRKIATSWWGSHWNLNLERYQDYANRLQRGRSYLRNGCVFDLQIIEKCITAIVQGSRRAPYEVQINIEPLATETWKALCQSCHGELDSLNALLVGEFPEALKDVMFDVERGMFPSPDEITFKCSCPDWASMCKHVAAALYGVGARLDQDPGLFFKMRAVLVDELIGESVAQVTDYLLRKADVKCGDIIADADISDLFGIDIQTGEQTRESQAIYEKAAREPKALEPQTATPIAVRKTRPNQIRSASKQKPTMVNIVINALGRSKKGLTVAALTEKLQLSESQIRTALASAKRKRLIEKTAEGTYRLSGGV